MPSQVNKNKAVDFIPDYKTIQPYFMGKKKHRDYYKALDLYEHMSFHFDGYFLHAQTRAELGERVGVQGENDIQANANVYFSRLIDMRRPSESDAIMAYRRVVFLPFTQGTCFKVYNSLRKIVKASDWKIDYTKSLVPAGVADDETLEKYCEDNYPRFNSVENWVYNYGMKNMLIDSNALIYVLPIDFDLPNETDYYQPVVTIVNSKAVLDYVENEYCVFVHDKKWEYIANGGVKKSGRRLGIITKDGYYEARQINSKQQFEIVEVGTFDMEYLPAWIIGGVPKKVRHSSILYDSFMSPMLPGLDAMAMALTDEEAEWVQHVYSTMWYFTQQDCKTCMGTGKVNSKGKQSITCSKCNGTGNAPKSPYRDMVLKAGTFDQQTMPTPPAGYIQKQTEIAKLFAQKIKDKEYSALSSINHEFLAESPAVTSGISKQFDRQELENYTYSVAYHLVEFVLKDVYYFINEFRYSQRVPNEEQREEMLPKIAIPTKYDLLTESIIEEQLKSAKEANLDPEIIGAVELEYIQKKFPNDTELRDRMRTIKQVDPFPGKTPEEKQSMLLSKSVLLEDVILSNYLYPFVERAITEHEGFNEMMYEDKIKILYDYVEEKKGKMDTAQKAKDKANPPVKEDPKNPGFDMSGKPIAKK